MAGIKGIGRLVRDGLRDVSKTEDVFCIRVEELSEGRRRELNLHHGSAMRDYLALVLAPTYKLWSWQVVSPLTSLSIMYLGGMQRLDSLEVDDAGY